MYQIIYIFGQNITTKIKIIYCFNTILNPQIHIVLKYFLQFLLPSFYFCLPSSYFFLPSSYFFLPSSYFFLPS